MGKKLKGSDYQIILSEVAEYRANLMHTVMETEYDRINTLDVIYCYMAIANEIMANYHNPELVKVTNYNPYINYMADIGNLYCDKDNYLKEWSRLIDKAQETQFKGKMLAA
jgi:vacuolar-type H+-ATPase catalytic subunit A/Vma1